MAKLILNAGKETKARKKAFELRKYTVNEIDKLYKEAING